MTKEPTCYHCGEQGRWASECTSKQENPHTRLYCHRRGHSAEDYFVRRNNEAIGKQDARLSQSNSPAENKGVERSKSSEMMFLKEEETILEDGAVAVFNRTGDEETLTKQNRMQYDIEAYKKAQVKPRVAVRVNPGHTVTQEVNKRKKKSSKKSACKVLIDALSERVQKYDLIYNSVLDQADITFERIAHDNIDYAKTELQRILGGKISVSIVSPADKY